MKIESIIRRKGGSRIHMFKSVYEFLPDATGRHVAEVTNKAHIERFLAIPEGYRPYDQPARTTPAPVVEDDDDDEPPLLVGSGVHPPVLTMPNGKQVSIDDAVVAAHIASGYTADEWNQLSDEVRHDAIDAVLDRWAEENAALEGDKQPDNPPPPAPEREALAAEYKARTGKLPHYRWSAEKIAAELAELPPVSPAEGQ